MKQLILSFFTVFFISRGFSQDTLLVHKVNSTSKEYRLIDIPDEENNRLYLFIMSQFAFDGYEIDLSTNTVTAEFSSPRPDEKGFEALANAVVKDRTVRLYFHANQEERFKIVRAHFNTRMLDINTVTIDSKDYGLGMFTYRDTLYNIKLQPKSSAFTLYRLGEDGFVKSTLDFSQTAYATLENKTAASFLTDKAPATWGLAGLLIKRTYTNVRYVSTDTSTSVLEAAPLKKVYLDNENHLVFTQDDKDFTRIWMIEPAKNKMRYKRVDKTFSQLNPEYKYCSNSYLHGNWLFQVNSGEQGLTIRIYDIQKDTTLAMYRVGSGPDTDLTINKMRGKVVKGFSTEPKEKIFKTKDEFLKNIYPGLIAIAITGQTPTHFNIRIGAFNPKNEEFFLDANIDRTNMPDTQDPAEPSAQEKRDMYAKLSAAIEQHTGTAPGQANQQGNVSIVGDKAIYSYYDKKNKKIGLIGFNIMDIVTK